MLRHDRLQYQISISGCIIVKSPLRIGGARIETPYQLADLSTARIKINDHHVPYIPGSSIKGVLRSISEKIQASNNNQYCNPNRTCGRIHGKKIKNIRGRAELAEFINENFCDVCKIYGSMGLKGFVFFTDAYPSSNETIKLGSKSQISINRRMGDTVRGSLHQVEYMYPGSKFDFNMLIQNLNDYQLALLFASIKMINSEQAYLGSFSTKGFGRVAFLFENVSVKIFDPSESGIKKKLEDFFKGRENISDEEYTRLVLNTFIKQLKGKGFDTTKR